MPPAVTGAVVAAIELNLAPVAARAASPADGFHLARASDLHGYHWETTECRALCAELGLDQDAGRPVFRDEYKHLGEELVQRVAMRRFRYDEDWGDEPEDPLAWKDDPMRPRWDKPQRRRAAVSAVCDFVDLLREDVHPAPALLDRVRRGFLEIAPGMPEDETFRRIAGSEDLLEHGRLPYRGTPVPGPPAGR
jgi:hypothetical protein